MFDWSFADNAPEYITFSKEGLDGGFYKSDLSSSTTNGNDLKTTHLQVIMPLDISKMKYFT